MDKDTKLENRFLSKLKSKHDTDQKDEVKQEKKKIQVDGLLDDVNHVPERVMIMGPAAHGKPSNKPDKKAENPKHGGAGKKMAGE